MFGLKTFTYPVAKDGYTWLDAESTGSFLGPAASKSRWLTDGIPQDVRWELRFYQPLEEPALFRIFAETPTDEDGVRQFANRFGLLGFPTTIILPEGHRFAKQPATGEELRVWHDQIRCMRLTLEVWDALHSRDIEALRHLFKVAPDGQFMEVYLEGRDGISDMLYVQPEHAQDLAGLARLYVQRTLNKWLENTVTPYMVNPEGDRLRIQWRPTHLLGAMWLQFALAVESGKQFRTCPECGTWFEVSSEGSRSTKQYCSDACRMRAYRSRRATTDKSE